MYIYIYKRIADEAQVDDGPKEISTVAACVVRVLQSTGHTMSSGRASSRPRQDFLGLSAAPFFKRILCVQ